MNADVRRRIEKVLKTYPEMTEHTRERILSTHERRSKEGARTYPRDKIDEDERLILDWIESGIAVLDYDEEEDRMIVRILDPNDRKSPRVS